MTIKELYDSKKIINTFTEIEFENLAAFINCRKHDLMTIDNKYLIFHIYTKKNLKILYSIFRQTRMDERCTRIDVYLHNKLIEERFRNFKYNIIIDFDTPFELFKRKKDREWLSKHKLFKDIYLTKENYYEQIIKIIHCYNETGVRFFILNFDYSSFEEMKLGEIHKFKWALRQLNIWMRDTEEPIVIKRSKFRKPIGITEDLIIKIGDNWEFKIMKYLEEDGESIDLKTLNHLRQYLDIKESSIYSDFPVFYIKEEEKKKLMKKPIRNWALVDFNQNLEVQGQLVEIPLITQLIDRWLM